MKLFGGTLLLGFLARTAAAVSDESNTSSTSSSVSITSSPSSSPTTSPSSTSSSAFSTSSTISITSSSSVVTATSTSSGLSYNTASTVLVNPDGSGQFTAINAALSYAQAKAIPTVYVKAGTYSEAVSVIGSAALTVVGETSSLNDYSKNQVIISNSSVPLTISTNSVTKTTFRNINFVTTGGSAVSLRGTKNAFYNCQFVSSGQQAVYSTLGITLIANSYIEGSTKVFAGFLGMYVYGSTIVATGSGATIAYTKGYQSTNSQLVFDQCYINQKSESTNTGVYLAAPNDNGAEVVWRSTYMGSLISASGVHPTASSYTDYYGEFNTTGAGSYAQNSASRIDVLMTTSALSSWTISQVFGNSWSPYATSDTTWIDSTVLAAIQSANSADIAAASSSSTSSSVSSSVSTSVSSSVSAAASSSISSSASSSVSSSASISGSSSMSSSVSSTISSSNSLSSTISSSSSVILSSSSSVSTSITSSTSTASSCALPTSMPSTAKVVGPSGSCANYTSLQAAINDLPSDSTTQYIYILAGTYTVTSQVNITRVGATIFRGESNSVLDQSSNLVTIVGSSALLSSQGTSEPYAIFRTTQYNSKKMAFYNINFENNYPSTKNYMAIAMDVKAQQVGFYSCGFKSSGGTLFEYYGSIYMAGCRIEGSQDFIWGYGLLYIYNSKIISNAAGYSIAAQSYQSSYGGSMFIFDHSAILPSSASIGQSSTYLGRDYSASSSVVYANSFIDAHIMSVGWSIGTTGTNVTFVEANNTGPGSSTSSRSSKVTVLSDASAYTTSKIFGDISWIDTAAVPAFSGFPDSVFGSTSSSISSSATGTSTISSSTSSAPSTTSSAACATNTLVVNAVPENACQYSNISVAIAALANDGLEKTILIYPGTYTEQISITRSGKVNLIGNTTFKNDFTQNTVTIQYNYGVSTSANQDELTPVINSKKSDLAVYNINFHNTFPQTNNYAALAADFYGSNMAFYGCSFIGYQDTLLLNKGVQVLSNCYIEGSVDFIWGYSTAFLHGCYIASNTGGSSVCAQYRTSGTSGGFVIDESLFTYTSSYGSTMGRTYLGRPWSSFSTVAVTNSYLDSHINSAGWAVWSTSNPQTSNVSFYEYNNVGPSSGTSSRASFSSVLSSSAAQAYTLSNWIGSTSWLDMDTYNLVPSYSWTSTSIETSSTSSSNSTATTTSSATSSATATASCGHPTSGTEVPYGAIIVDAANATTGSYVNLTSALAGLPSDSTCQTVFLMPGTYNEQVNVNRPGQTRIIGYQSGNPGQTYSANQVTVSYARGLSVSPLPTGHSDAETAVISTSSTNIAFYNVDFINTDNLDGATSSYVTLAGSLYGSHIACYGCSFVGWQDTLLTGASAGYMYFESSYIEGAIDYIWGYSAAYFKGCTLASKRKSSAITAHSRASSSAIGIYVFDQCLVTAAEGYSSLESVVYLGRPYSQYARVIYKYSYLDTIVAPAGWKVWSSTDPRTDHILFGEYENDGPGNWANNAAARQTFGNATLLTSDTYTLASVMDSTSWIDTTYWDSIVTPSSSSSSTSGNSTTATIANSTTPADDAYIVSQTDIPGKTVYYNISAAITAISGISSSKTVTVFIYPGTYDEQLTYNRSGTTIFQGYTEYPDDNTKNEVIIQNSRGVDTQGDESNSNSATLYTRAKYLQLYNLNLNNVFGTTHDYASLGFAIGNNGYAGLYGCQVTGNQDTFDLNSGTSVFVYNSLIEGSIDFIWGAGSGYFLGSTIVPNYGSGSITADKRATNTSVGGLVFDQCTVSAASSVASGTVYLGRPYNQYARVAWIESYLDDSIAPAGWSVWSSSKPQTDGVTFGEYHNTGPGSDTSARASFSEQFSDSDVVQFQLANFFSTQGTAWINMTHVSTSPFSAGTYSTTSTVSYCTSTVYTTSTVLATVTTPAGTVVKTTTQSTKATTVLPASTTTTTKQNTVKATSYSTTTLSPSTKYSTVYTTIGSTSTSTPANVVVTKTSTTKITTGSVVTVTPSPVTVVKYSTVRTTIGSSSTVTPESKTVTKSTTLRTTVGSVVTVSPSPVYITKFKTESTTVGSTKTVTPDDSTVVKTSKVTETTLYTTSYPASTTTLTEKFTTQILSTSSPAATLVTIKSTSYIETTSYVTPKGHTTTVTKSTVTIPGTTKTSTPKATTSWVTTYSTVSKTVKSTTKLSCTPLAKRDDVSVNRFNIRAVISPVVTVTICTTVGSTTVAGDSTTSTTTEFSTFLVTSTPKPTTETDYSTITSTVTTKVSTVNAETQTFTLTSTDSIDAVVTLKPQTSTVTELFTSISNIDETTTLKGSTYTTTDTLTMTSLIDGATTLKTGTVTSTLTALETSSIDSTTSLKGQTYTISDTTTIVQSVDQTTTLPASSTTEFSFVTAFVTSTVKTTPPASTVTNSQTISLTSVTTLPKSTSTYTQLVTATSKIVSTLPAVTSEVDKTATTTASPITITAEAATTVKTKTLKTTIYSTSTVTSYSKGATTCAA